MKVLVLGASGSIGKPVAEAFSRAGHEVYGQTRSASKAKQLALEEVIPVIGEPDSDIWLQLIPTLDVVIDAVGGGDIKAYSQTLLTKLSNAAAATRHPSAPKLTFIYTSGTWVHGDDRNEIVTDTTPITKPAELVAWRPEQEQRVINNSVLNGIVIRPGLVYGHSGSLLADLFRTSLDGKVVWPGTPGGRYAVVHSDDLADLYLRVAEKSSIVGGKIFDAVSEQSESVDDLLARLVLVSGAKAPYEYRTPENTYESAIGTTTLIRPYLAHALLGWKTKKPGLIDGLQGYYTAFLASQEDEVSTKVFMSRIL